MHFLNYIVQYRLDSIAFLVVALLGAFLSRRAIRRRCPGQSLPRRTWPIIGLILLSGISLAEWSAAQRRQSLASILSGFGATYAVELQKLGHARITRDTPPGDPTYLALISAEKDWLRANPLISDIYTFRIGADGSAYFLVDSETDYNRNGRIDEAREQRTPIGETYPETNDVFRSALRGVAAFDANIGTDRWGMWVTSVTPLLDASGHVEAAVGIDYSATDWLHSVASNRIACLLVMLVLVGVALSSGSLIALMRGEVQDRRDAEARLLNAKEAADHASHAKSEFLAVMSHEIRTPLTAVMGFASVLSETQLDPTQQRYVNTIVSAGDRLVAMLNDILDLTKMEEGKLSLENFPFLPELLIDEVVDLMTACSMEKNLVLQLVDNTPEAFAIEGDPARLRQILLNLVSNAVKFTDRGTITVRTGWTPPAAPTAKGRFTIDVIDTGIGIQTERISSLFQTFSQVHSSTRRYNGSGLGLVICKRLAELMGGTISVESAFGSGSRFTVSLPCKSTPAPAHALAAATTRGKSGTAPPLPGRALVVDDQSINREVLKLMLRRQGCLADTAESGSEAILLSAQNRYAVIFMDLEMPGLDGFATTRKIRAEELPGQHIPIVAVTATTTKGTREKCLEAGMDEYLTKPVYQPALKSTLEAMLRTQPVANAPTG